MRAVRHFGGMTATRLSKLRIARLHAGLTQTELGLKVGKSRHWVLRAETNAPRCRITDDDVRHLADALNRPAEELFHLSGGDR